MAPAGPQPEFASENAALTAVLDTKAPLLDGESGYEGRKLAQGVTWSYAPSRTLSLQMVFAASSTLIIMLACMWFKDQAFVWTMHSPKFVFVGLWSICNHLVVSAVVGEGVWGAAFGAKGTI